MFRVFLYGIMGKPHLSVQLNKTEDKKYENIVEKYLKNLYIPVISRLKCIYWVSGMLDGSVVEAKKYNASAEHTNWEVRHLFC